MYNLRDLVLANALFGGNTGGGGGGGSAEEWIGDGKTHLWIKIAAEGRMGVSLYFSQTVANGVTIDWGDGSAPQTLSGTDKVKTTHTYASIGEYCITLDVADGCTLGLGRGSQMYCVLGTTSANSKVYTNRLQKAEIGNGVTSLNGYAFSNCYSLASISIPDSVTSIGSNAFDACCGLAKIRFDGMTPPTVANSNAFTGILTDCVISVPVGCLNAYKAAANYPDPATYTYIEE